MSCFRSPVENFSNLLETILNENIFSNSQCVLIGDFNANLLSSGGGIDEFKDMMHSHHYLQIITDVTHPGTDFSAPSLIDLIWINRLTIYNAGLIKTGITDHYTLFIQLPFLCHKPNSQKIKVTFRDCSLANQETFENNLSLFDWDTVKDVDINLYTTNFIFALNDPKIFEFKISASSQQRCFSC